MRIDLPHIAFLRSVIDGMDVNAAFDRYLSLIYDGRRVDSSFVRQTLMEVHETCAGAALEAGKPELAKLFDFDVLALTGNSETAPEKERITVGGEAIVQALEQIETQFARRPVPSDPIDDWFAPRIASCLQASGIVSLHALCVRMMSPYWHTSISGIGRLKAERLEAFMREWSLTTDERAAWPAVPIDTGSQAADNAELLVPATFLTLVNVLDDPASASNALGAQTHADAVRAFLSRYSGHTLRAYRREVERLLIWATFERRKRIVEFVRQDVIAYRDFLEDPQPREHWCAPRNIPKNSPAWRPLEGPLSEASLRQSTIIIGKMFTFFVQTGIMRLNPALHLPRPGRQNLRQQFGRRLLSRADLDLLREHAGPGARGERTVLLLDLLYATGLRISEAAGAMFKHVMPLGEGYLLGVVGKGKKYREVPVPAEIIDRARRMAHARGAQGARANGAYLLGWVGPKGLTISLDPYEGVNALVLARDVKQAAERAAESVKAQDPARAERLLGASAHWLRHSHASHALEAGVALTAVQANLGHTSLVTTSVYATTEQSLRMQQMQEFWQQSSGDSDR